MSTYERERHQKISLLQVLLPIRAIYVILRSFLPHYRLVLSINPTRNRTNLLVAPNRDLVKSKRNGRQDDSKEFVMTKIEKSMNLKFIDYVNFTKCERESRNLSVRRYKCEKCRIGKSEF